jgi:hypothetical protein
MYFRTMIQMYDTEDLLINVRNLVALDITLHGQRFILVEFGLGTPAIIIVGLLLISASSVPLLGLYLLLTGINYLPLLAYATVLVRAVLLKRRFHTGCLMISTTIVNTAYSSY